MNKLITIVALIALASTTMVGTASAKLGKPGPGSMIGNQAPGNISQQQPGAKPGKGGPSYGGEATSPGDAFYPDSGDDTCDGVIKYQFDDSGILVPVCLF